MDEQEQRSAGASTETSRQTGCLLIDLVGSTANTINLTEQRLVEHHSRMATALDPHLAGLSLQEAIVAFTGDGWLVFVQDQNQFAALSLLGLILIDCLPSQLQMDSAVRAAIGFGFDLCRTVGSGQTCVGDSARIANRISQFCGPNSMLVSEAFKGVAHERNFQWERFDVSAALAQLRTAGSKPKWEQDISVWTLVRPKVEVEASALPELSYYLTILGQEEKAIEVTDVLAKELVWRKPTKAKPKPDIAKARRLLAAQVNQADAKRVFEELAFLKEDVFSWNLRLRHEAKYEGAALLLQEMKAARVVPDVVTFSTLVNLAKDYDSARAVFEEMKAASVLPNVFTFSTLIAKAKDYDSARAVFEEMKAASVLPSVFTFNTLFSKDLQQVDAQELIEWYLAQPFHPELPLQAMIKSFKRAGQHDKVARIVLHYPHLPAAQKVFRENPQICVAYFRSLLELDPSHPNALYALGIALLDSGSKLEAIPWLEKALVQAAIRDPNGKRAAHLRSLIVELKAT